MLSFYPTVLLFETMKLNSEINWGKEKYSLNSSCLPEHLIKAMIEPDASDKLSVYVD